MRYVKVEYAWTKTSDDTLLRHIHIDLYTYTSGDGLEIRTTVNEQVWLIGSVSEIISHIELKVKVWHRMMKINESVETMELRQCIPTIDSEVSTSRVTRSIRGQVEIGTPQLFRLALTAHGDLVTPDILNLLGDKG